MIKKLYHLAIAIGLLLLLGESASATFIQSGFNPHGPVEACGAYEVDGATAQGYAYNSSHHVYTFDGTLSTTNPTGTLNLTSGNPPITSSNCCTDNYGHHVNLSSVTNFPNLTLQQVQTFASDGADGNPTPNFPYYDSDGYVIFNPYGSKAVYCPSPSRSGSSLYINYDQDEVYQIYEQDIAHPGVAGSTFFSPAINVSQRYCVGGLLPYPSGCSFLSGDWWPSIFWYGAGPASELLLLAEFTAGASTGSNITFPMPSCWRWMCVGGMVSGSATLTINQCDHIGTASVVRMCARLNYSGLKGQADYLGNSHTDYYSYLGNRTAVDADYRTPGKGNPYAGPYAYPPASGHTYTTINNIYILQAASNPGSPFSYVALTNGILTGSTTSTTALQTGNVGATCAATPTAASCSWTNNMSDGSSASWALTSGYAPGGSAYSINPSGIAELPLQATQQVTLPNGGTSTVNILLRLKNGRVVNPREQLCAYLDPGDIMDPDWATTQWAQHNQPNPKATHLYSATFGQLGSVMGGSSGSAAQGASIGLIGAGVMFAGAGPFIAATAAAFAIVDAITAKLNTVVVMNEGCVDLVLGPYPPPPTIRIQPTAPTVSSQPICTMTTKAFPTISGSTTTYQPYYQNPEDALPTCATIATPQNSVPGAQCNCPTSSGVLTRMSTAAAPCDMATPQASATGAQCNCNTATGQTSSGAYPCDDPSQADGLTYSASNPTCAPASYVGTYSSSNPTCASTTVSTTPTYQCTCAAGQISTDTSPCLPPDANPSLVCGCPFGEVPQTDGSFNWNGSAVPCAVPSGLGLTASTNSAANTSSYTATPTTNSGYTPGFSTFEQPRVRIGYNDVIPFCASGQATTSANPCACPYSGSNVSQQVFATKCIQWKLSTASSGYQVSGGITNSSLVDDPVNAQPPYARLAYQSAGATNGYLTRTAYGIMVGDYEDAEDDFSAQYTLNTTPGLEKVRTEVRGASGLDSGNNVVPLNIPYTSGSSTVASDTYFLAMDDPTQTCIYAKGSTGNVTTLSASSYCTTINSVLATSGGGTYTCTSSDVGSNVPEALCVNRPKPPNPTVHAAPNGNCANLPDPVDSQNAIPQLCTSYTHPMIMVSLGDNVTQSQMLGAKTGNQCTTLHGVSFCSLVEGLPANTVAKNVVDENATAGNPASYIVQTYPDPPGLVTGPYQYPSGPYSGLLSNNPFSWTSSDHTHVTVYQPAHGLSTAYSSTTDDITVTFTGLPTPNVTMNDTSSGSSDGTIALSNSTPYTIQNVTDSSHYTINVPRGSSMPYSIFGPTVNATGGGPSVGFTLSASATAMPGGGSCYGVTMTINNNDSANRMAVPMGCHCEGITTTPAWSNAYTTLTPAGVDASGNNLAYLPSPVQTYNTCPANPQEDGYQRGGLQLCLNYDLTPELVRTTQETTTTTVGLAAGGGRTVQIVDSTVNWQEWQNSTAANQCNCGYNSRTYNPTAPCDDATHAPSGKTYSASNPYCMPGYNTANPLAVNLTYEAEQMSGSTSTGTMNVNSATCLACGSTIATSAAMTDLQYAVGGCMCNTSLTPSQSSTAVVPCDATSKFTGEPTCPAAYANLATTVNAQPGAVIVNNNGTVTVSSYLQNLVQTKNAPLPIPFPQSNVVQNAQPDLSGNPCTVLMATYSPGQTINYFQYPYVPNTPPYPVILQSYTGTSNQPCSGSHTIPPATAANEPAPFYEAVTSGTPAPQYCQQIPGLYCPAIMQTDTVNFPPASNGYAEWYTGTSTSPGPVPPGTKIARQCDTNITYNGVPVTLTQPNGGPTKVCQGSSVAGSVNEGLSSWSPTTTGTCYVCPDEWYYMSAYKEFAVFKFPAAFAGQTYHYTGGFTYHGGITNNQDHGQGTATMGLYWNTFTASCGTDGKWTTSEDSNGTWTSGGGKAVGHQANSSNSWNTYWWPSSWGSPTCNGNRSIGGDSGSDNNNMSMNEVQDNSNGQHIACGVNYSGSYSAFGVAPVSTDGTYASDGTAVYIPTVSSSPPSGWPTQQNLDASCDTSHAVINPTNHAGDTGATYDLEYASGFGNACFKW